MVLLHGLPGNEKNLDLAQAIRRAGWTVVTFNYRGSWGSPGVFRFEQDQQDADAVLAYLRDPANAKALGVDTRRLVIMGHSMGGWVAANTAADDKGLIGLVTFSAWDTGNLDPEDDPGEGDEREHGILGRRYSREHGRGRHDRRAAALHAQGRSGPGRHALPGPYGG